ncbi:hypothetical protein XENTR_v10010971 [Xenopus tropicalis]|nr:hypothetical protein XENTR_v10010971 [Xenopus tropicalis]
MTFAFFQSLGTIPDERESENIRNKGHCNSAPSSLSTRGCMPSGPGALFTFIVCNPLSTISCANHCVVGAEATVQLLGGTWPTGSSTVYTEEKNLLSTSAFSVSAVTILLL